MCGLLTRAGETEWRARWGWRGWRRTCIRVVWGEGVVVKALVEVWVRGRRLEEESLEVVKRAEVWRERRAKLGRRKGRRRKGVVNGDDIVVVVDMVTAELRSRMKQLGLFHRQDRR